MITFDQFVEEYKKSPKQKVIDKIDRYVSTGRTDKVQRLQSINKEHDDLSIDRIKEKSTEPEKKDKEYKEDINSGKFGSAKTKKVISNFYRGGGPDRHNNLPVKMNRRLKRFRELSSEVK